MPEERYTSPRSSYDKNKQEKSRGGTTVPDKNERREACRSEDRRQRTEEPAAMRGAPDAADEHIAQCPQNAGTGNCTANLFVPAESRLTKYRRGEEKQCRRGGKEAEVGGAQDPDSGVE